MSTTMPTCPSRSIGAYATHGAASGSIPSNCIGPTKRSPRAQNMDAQSRGTRDNAVRLRHVEPARVPLRHAASVGERTIARTTRFPIWTRFSRREVRASSEATLRRRRILFAGFVARMEDTRLSKCVMFGELVGGAGCVGGQEK